MNVSTPDKKVLSTLVKVGNGANVLIDGLETSIVEAAPFSTVFSKIILNFREVPECSISVLVFYHGQGPNVQE
jgi:hypothetical protein